MRDVGSLILRYNKLKTQLEDVGRELLLAIELTRDEEKQVDLIVQELFKNYDADDWCEEHRGKVADLILEARDGIPLPLLLRAEEEEEDGTN